MVLDGSTPHLRGSVQEVPGVDLPGGKPRAWLPVDQQTPCGRILVNPEGPWMEDPAGAITTQPACEDGTILSAEAEPWARFSRPRAAKIRPRIFCSKLASVDGDSMVSVSLKARGGWSSCAVGTGVPVSSTGDFWSSWGFLAPSREDKEGPVSFDFSLGLPKLLISSLEEDECGLEALVERSLSESQPLGLEVLLDLEAIKLSHKEQKMKKNQNL